MHQNVNRIVKDGLDCRDVNRAVIAREGGGGGRREGVLNSYIRVLPDEYLQAEC